MQRKRKLQSTHFGRLTAILLCILITAVFSLPNTMPANAATSVSDYFKGLPINADPGTGTTKWLTGTKDGGTVLKSGNSGKSNSTSTLTLTFTADTHISFEYKVSTEQNYDKFNIKLGDTSLVKDASGEKSWTAIERDVKSGQTMTFTYKKDSSGDKGDDTCYLRNFSAGTALTVTFHNGTETKVQNIYGGKGTLQKNSWTPAGKTFAGWATTENGGVVYKDSAAIELSDNINLYAVWNDAYIVTFKNGSSETKINTPQHSAIGESNLPADPSKTGYTFEGWYNGETKLTRDTVIDSDVTYTAKWLPITYTIKFDANGGTGSTDAINAVYDEEVTLPDNGFSHDGYTFQGWGTSSYSKTYDAGQKVKNLQTKQDGVQTLYAIWEGNPVNVTIDPNYEGAEKTERVGVVGKNYNYVAQNGKSSFSELKDPSRNGYIFKGWSDKPNDGNEITNQYKFTAEDAENGKTLYAQWAEAVTITLDANGGTLSSYYSKPKTIEKGSTYNLSYTTPTAPGDKLFDGWYTEKEGGTKVDSKTVYDKDITLYAHYRGYQNTITFKANGGEGSMEDFIVNDGENTKLPKNKFTREGYRFTGWSSSSYSSNIAYTDEADYSWTAVEDWYGDKEDESTTLYAQWKETVFNKAFTAIKEKIPADSIIKEPGALDLPTSGEGYTVSYKVNDMTVASVSDEGKVTINALPEIGTKELKVTAMVTDTSDNTTETKDFILTVYSEDSARTKTELEEAAKSLTGNLSPVFGKDKSAVDMVSKRLKDAGYEDVTVTVKEKAAGNYASIAKDGTIDYYFNPAMSGNADYACHPVFVLSKGGQQIEKEMSAIIPWNEDKVKQVLEAQLDHITLPETALIADDLKTLPRYPVKDGVLNPNYNDTTDLNAWATVTWSSSDESVVKANEAPSTPYFGPYPVTVNPKKDDTRVTLTASIKCNSVSNVTVKKEYSITIKGSSESREETIRKKLEQAFENGYGENGKGLTDFYTGEKLDLDNIKGNIQFPTTGDLKIDGKYQPMTISSSNEDVAETWKKSDGTPLNNAASVNIYRPLPGENAEKVTITVTITDKASGVEFSKPMEITVQPLTQKELDDAKDLMRRAVDGYWDGIKNANTDKNNITSNLQNFQEINVDSEGNLSYIYDYNDRTWAGVIADDYVEHPDGSNDNDYRKFNSDKEALIANSTLLLGEKPQYDTSVTISSYLTDEIYGKYYEKYRDAGDIEKADLFKEFYRQYTFANVVVKGVNGANPNPDQKIKVNFSITGFSDGGFTESIEMPPYSTAGDVVEQLLQKHGYSFKGSTSYIRAIISPSNETLDEKGKGDNSGWMYRVNGTLPDKLLSQYVLSDGDTITLFYTKDYTQEGGMTGGDGEFTVAFDLDGGTVDGKTAVETQKVAKGGKAKAPADPVKEGYTFAGWYNGSSKFDFSTSVAESITLKAKWTKKGKVTPEPAPKPAKVKINKIYSSGSYSGKTVAVKWNKVKTAKGYDIFMAKCGSKGKLAQKKYLAKSVKKGTIVKASLKTLRGGKKFSSRNSYKVQVKAYNIVNGKKHYLTSSPAIHIVHTKNGIYTNAVKVTVSLKNVTLKAGKTKTIKAKAYKENSGKKWISKSHTDRVRYYTTNSSVASVSSSGKIKARKKGACTVYAMAANGIKAKVNVTVK